jgi:hypothetical protein
MSDSQQKQQEPSEQEQHQAVQSKEQRGGRANIHVVYMEQRRRALITELRAVEELLGLPQSIPPRKR